MALGADRLFIAVRYLIPKNNLWLKRTSLLFTFIFLDYLVTLLLCTTPADEGNLFARSFMEAYGIQVGLTLFVLVANLPVYLMLSLNSHLFNLPPKLSKTVEASADVAFAWLIAGLHFSGATSWVWFAPDILRQALGASTYLFIIFSLRHKIHRST
jgi:hypothetical protein